MCDEAFTGANFVNRIGEKSIAIVSLTEIPGPGDDTIRNAGNFREATFVAPGRHDIPAGFRKSDGDRCADSRTCARDQCYAHGDFPAGYYVLSSVSHGIKGIVTKPRLAPFLSIAG